MKVQKELDKHAVWLDWRDKACRVGKEPAKASLSGFNLRGADLRAIDFLEIEAEAKGWIVDRTKQGD